MALTEAPCTLANSVALLSGSALMMKLIWPWRYRVTFLERWRATAAKPIASSTPAIGCGSGAVYSTNSKPSVPMGLSNKSLGLREDEICVAWPIMVSWWRERTLAWLALARAPGGLVCGLSLLHG